jgi:crotonobetainyl-CoA:carnitine CoA-transferase CaiB-like acyl-CoA transferase
MGYGPLVRAATGITRLWTAGKTGDLGPPFLDAVTVFPDHVVARIVAISALGALIRRDRTGRGAHVHISQAEAAVNQLDAVFAAEQARATGLAVTGDEAMHGVYRCAGDDEWCVISVRDDVDWDALASAIGRKGLSRTDCDITTAVTAWTETRERAEVTRRLQLAGVPAGPMNRPIDVLVDPQVEHRKFLTDMAHPVFDAPLPAETGPAHYRNIPPADLRPAPMPGEHTREVCQKILGLDTGEIDRLIADGVLFTAPPGTSWSSD